MIARRLLLAAIAAVLALVGSARAQIIETPETKVIPRLTVRGDAELRKPADELRLDVGVLTEHAEAAVALAENTRKMQAIIASLKTTGLDKDEYQTRRFQLRPTYSRRPRQADASWRPEIIGYAVSNAISIRTKQLELAGRLIEASNRAGANSIDNIRFDLSDRRAYRAEAISEATGNAIEDARTLAASAGLRLVRILSINLDSAAAHTPRPQAGMARTMAAEAVGAPPIDPGDIRVTANVTVVYEIAEAEAEAEEE